MLPPQRNRFDMHRIQKFTRHRNFPIIVILLFGIILGFLIFQDFGASYDEPSYYFFGGITLSAYTNPGSRVYQNFYRHYGQPFFIVGYGIHALLSLIFPQALSIDIWHLIVYFSFLLGIFFFYKLAQRWVSTSAAAISTLLFASQPVFFGLSWFDPKDMPFMVFFLGAVYFGLAFSDQARLVFRDQARPEQDVQMNPVQKSTVHTKRAKTAAVFGIVLGLLALILEIAADAIRRLITNTILSINIKHPANFMDRLFVKFAHHASNLPLANYAVKVTTIFNQLLGWFLVITLLYLIVIIYFWFQPFFNKQFNSLYNFLAGLVNNYANYPHKKAFIASFIGACVFLAFASATRTVGPFAALLVIWVWVINLKKKSIPLIVFYGLASFLVFFLSWPYLWQDTLPHLIAGILNITDFPDPHTVLFGGRFYDSRALPASYLPTLLAISLTEPAVLFIVLGVIVSVYRFTKKEISRTEILIPLVWFFLPFFYVVITTPNIYDNYRQLLFIMPGAFLFSALSINFIFQKIKRAWMNGLLMLAILFPGFLANVQLHPYEYTYYNSMVGGVKGAAYKYEIDVWLTCYKKLTQQINASEKGQINVYADSNPGLVNLYANKNITVINPEIVPYPAGSLITLPMRFDHELYYPQYPIAYSVDRDGIDLCVAKRVK